MSVQANLEDYTGQPKLILRAGVGHGQNVHLNLEMNGFHFMSPDIQVAPCEIIE
jgi:hypothetical protein